MKNHLLKRILSMLLVVALLAGYYVPGAQAASAKLTWKESDQEIKLDLSHREAQIHVKEPHAPTDMVRVSIVLEEKSTVQAGFPTRNIASNPEAMAYSRSLRDKQEVMAQTISTQALGGAKLDVVWNLTLVGNIISVNVPYGKLEAIAKVDGVAAVVVENVYEPCVVDRGNVAEPQMYASLHMTGSSLVWSSGYTGAGSRVAVIDTGTDTDHQSLDAGAFLYSLQQNAAAEGVSYERYLEGLNLLDEQEIASVLRDLNIYEKDSSLTADELYLNEKLPFAVNYIDGSNRRLVVDHERDDQGEHGSHVAGIATANRYIPSGNGYTDALRSVMVAGIAPDAQLITMKVFGYYGGPSDGDYLAAVEDAILLGCDAVNLSLGTATAGNSMNAYYADVLNYLTTTDTVMVASAGNSYAWPEASMYGYLYSQDVNLDTVGSPGSYYSSLSVASVENDGGVGPAFLVGDRVVGYNDAAYDFYLSSFTSLDTSYDGSGTEYEYIFIDGLGYPEDYAGMDLNGKIVFCSRGTTNFADKANAAVDRGAAATVVYNNQPGALYMNMSGYYYYNPCVSITQADANAIRNMSQQKQTSGGLTYYTGTMTVLSQYTGVMYNSEYLTMSDFSSWGVPGSLTIKPEITAPGGMIYSIYGETPYGGGTDQYEIMSGTSMAAPAVTGMTALVAQYLRETGLAEEQGMRIRAMAQSLLMSTAVPMVEEASGSYYSILKQGAGLARADLATSADSYILVSGQSDGKVKAELGDDPGRTGVYSFSFTINNLTDRALSYNLSAELFRQGSFDYDNMTMLDPWTTSLPGTASFTVNGQSVSNGGDRPDHDLNGDGRTDGADADHLLEYLVGNVANIQGNGDISGDGQVTSYDAHVLLTKLSGAGTVSVPAGGSATIGVTLTLTEGAKALLDATFENGTYVQAYVYAESTSTAEGVAGTRHSIPVLAFYGNWSDPNMFDHGSYVELAHDDYSGLTPYLYYEVGGSGNALTIDYGDGIEYYFGGNPVEWSGDYKPERNAFNSRDESYLVGQYFSLIRNAADTQLVISNADTGEIYLQTQCGQWDSAAYYVNAGYWLNAQQSTYLYWTGDDAYGNPLPDGTRVEVSFIAVPEYYQNENGTMNYENLGDGVYLVTPMTIDNTAPELLDMHLEGSTLTVEARDNQYVAGVAVLTSNDSVIAVEAADQNNAGSVVTVELDLTNVMGENFQLAVYDYAMNQHVVDVTLDLPEPERPYFTITSFYDNSYYGLNANGSSVELATSGRGLTEAAEYVNGYVYEITDGGYLYYADDNDLYNFYYMDQLDSDYEYDVTNFLDLAYNYADGKLYCLFYANRNYEATPYLGTVDMYSGAMQVLYELPVDVQNMAIDGDGNFYSVTYDAPYLYTYTLSSLSWDEMYYVGQVGYYSTTTRNSLTWDHNTDTLYWAYPEILLEIDHNTAEPSVVCYVDYIMTALYIRPEDANGANGMTIAPAEGTAPADRPAGTNTDLDSLVEAKASRNETVNTEPTEVPGGGLNTVNGTVPQGTVDPHSAGEFQEQSGVVTVTLTSGKEQEDSTNGRMTVTYKPWQLKLVSVTGATEAFAYAAEDGMVEVAFASTSAIGGETSVAVLTFEVLEPGEHEISVLHTEDGDSPFDKEELLTVTSQAPHVYRTEVTAPTCTEEGCTTYICTDCGYSYVDDYVDPLGHDYVETVTAPTCDEDGYTTYTCTRCGDSHVDDVVPALGHDYVGGVCTRCGDGIVSLELVSAPTVTSYAVGDSVNLEGIEVAGYYENGDYMILTAEDLTVLSCDMSTVGKSTVTVGIGDLSVAFHIYVHARRIDTVLDASLYPESDHDYGNNANDWQTVSWPGASSLTLQFSSSTYLEYNFDFIYVYDGMDNLIASYTGDQAAGVFLTVPGDTVKINLVTDYSVSYYGYSISRITANAVEHTGESVGSQEPTCTEPGFQEAFECEICGEHFGAQMIPALGHDHEITVTDPTCDQDGYTTYTCRRCGDVTKRDFVDAYGHSYDNGVTYTEPTATADGTMSTTCGNCGKVTTIILANDVHAPAGSPFHDWEWEVLQITNSLRCNAGLEPLTGFALLQEAAGIRAEEIDDYFDHTRPDGRSCFSVFDDIGLDYYGAGENIAYGYNTPAYVMYGWMNSQGHRENILTDWFEHLGVGYEYISAHDWTQMFLSGDGYSTYQLVLPDDTTYEAGTLIDEMGVYMLLDSNYYGQCYLPIQSMYCEGYDPNRIGTQTVTVSVLGFTDSFQVTIAGDDPCDDGHTPVVRGAEEATCTEPGYTGDTYCSVCGQLIEEGETIPAPGHSYGSWRQTIAPGCETPGQERRDCANCDHYEIREVGPIGHDYDAVVTEPTCTEGGYTTYTCANCGHSYVGDYTDPIGHDYDAVVTNPTCTEGGYTTYTCANCGYSYVDDYTAPIDHDYDSVVTAPTCTEQGYTTYTCVHCGYSYVDNYTAPVPHRYNSVVTEPTCTEQGYTTYTCPDCGHSYVGDYTDPVDHSYEDGYCEWCGEKQNYVRWLVATTSLNGTIDLNIYVVLSEDILNDPDAVIRFEHSGVTVEVPASKGIPSEKGGIACYRYSCEIYAKQVADTVTVQVVDGSGTIGNPLEYSVMQYCVNQIKKAQDEKQVAVCKAMLNYAAAAQTYFGYNTDNLANASLSEADKVLPEVDASECKFTVEGAEPGIKARSATLMLEAEVSIRVYFTLETGYTIDDFTFTIDGEEVEVQQNNKGYYIESDGIPAKELENMHKFCVGGLTVNYGALSYVHSKVTNANTSVAEANLAKALYAYYVAAEELLG